MTTADTMLRKRIAGFCSVASEQSCWHLPRSEFQKVRTAWIKGANFVDTVGFYGDALTIRLSGGESIIDFAPESIAASQADQRSDELDDTLAGGAA